MSALPGPGEGREADGASGALGALAALPVFGRAEHVRALAIRTNGGDVAALLGGLAGEVERLTAADIGQALATSEWLLALALAMESPIAAAHLGRVRAQALAHGGDFDAALRLGRDTTERAAAAGLPVEAARAQLVTMHVLARMGESDAALAMGETARQALLSAGQVALAARADVNLGAVYRLRDDPRAALTHYDRAREALSTDPVSRAQLDTNRGVALIALDAFRDAEAAFASAVEIFRRHDLPWALAVAEGNLASLAMRQGLADRALTHFEHALANLNPDDAPADWARLRAEQAEVLGQLGAFAEAARVYDQVLLTLERHGLVAEMAAAQTGLGRALLYLGRAEEADTLLASAAGHYDALGLATSRARTDVIRAEALVTRGEDDEALVILSRALAAFAPLSADAAATLVGLARLHAGRGDIGAAREALGRARPIIDALDTGPARVDLAHAEGIIAREGGDRDAAHAWFGEAVEAVERSRQTIRAERLRTTFLADRATIFDDLLGEALTRRPVSPGEVFRAIEAAKSRSLLDAVEVGPGGSQPPGGFGPSPGAPGSTVRGAITDLSEALTLARAELAWWSGRVAALSDRAVPEVMEARAALRQREDAYDDLRQRFASVEASDPTAMSPVTLAAAQATLPAGTALIDYATLGDDLVALVIRPDGAEVVRQAGVVPALGEHLRRFHFQMGRGLAAGQMPVTPARRARLDADAARERTALWDILIEPLRAAIGVADRLVIVPHGDLHTLPFAALTDPAGGESALDRWEIRHVASASVQTRLAKRPSPVPGPDPGPGQGAGRDMVRAVVIGVPDARIPEVEREVRAVAAALGRADVLLGEAATVDRVSAAVAGADLVHIACHGSFDPGRPLSSGLRLADRWLTVREISTLRFSASLVVLSGCETGVGGVERGDEVTGLTRGFFTAGARSLLVSLWPVDDVATARLMRVFYDAWTRGASGPAALRAAQREMAADGVHPALWAAFVMVGGT